MGVATTRSRVSVLACLVLLSMARPAPVAGGDQPRARWWLDTEVQRDLGLTQAQVKALQRTFERGLPERIELRRELDRRDAQLQQLLERGDAEDAVVERASVRVEDARARRNVRRTLMLLEMYRILTPAQRVGLSRLRAPGAAPASEPPVPSAAAPP